MLHTVHHQQGEMNGVTFSDIFTVQVYNTCTGTIRALLEQFVMPYGHQFFKADTTEHKANFTGLKLWISLSCQQLLELRGNKELV
jgi:hypothetical protein